MADKLIPYYLLSESMYGKDAYPAKGKIHLDADTKQEDLSYLFNDCGMTNCISELQLNKGQLESLENKRKKRKEADAKPERDSAPKKKEKSKEEDKSD